MARAWRTSGYLVVMANDGTQALSSVIERRPDACILDVAMPGMTGLEVTRALRSNANTTPILLLTARAELDARVEGLDAGADDYLAKPFDLPELLARVRALLRRAPQGGTSSECLGISIQPMTRQALRDGEPLQLTRIEFDLLEALVSRAGEVLTQEYLYQRVWGYDFGRGSKNLAVYITYLRAKLEAGGAPRIIESVRGVGYVLREESH